MTLQVPINAYRSGISQSYQKRCYTLQPSVDNNSLLSMKHKLDTPSINGGYTINAAAINANQTAENTQRLENLQKRLLRTERKLFFTILFLVIFLLVFLAFVCYIILERRQSLIVEINCNLICILLITRKVKKPLSGEQMCFFSCFETFRNFH